MVDLRWPGGADQGEGAERVFSQVQSGVRRKRTLFEPPEGSPPRPDLVPTQFWRSAVKEDLLTRGQAIGLRQDGLDTAFNYEVEAAREQISGIGSPRDLAQLVDRPKPITNASLVEYRSREVLAEIRREALEKVRGNYAQFSGQMQLAQQVYSWIPPQVEPEDKGLLDRLGDVVSAAGDVLGFARSLDPVSLGMRAISLTPIDEAVGAVAGRVPLLDEARALTDFGSLVTTPGRLFNSSPEQSVKTISAAASVLGGSFEGREFWRSVWVNGGAAAAHRMNPDISFDEYRHRAERNFDEYWDDLPRPLQLFVDELNPGNVGLVLAGGPLSRTLLASGTRGGRLLGGLVEPLASNPLKAVPYEVLASVGARYAYEETEGAPLPVRLAAGAVGAVAVPGAIEAGIRSLGKVDDALADEAIRAATGALDASTRQNYNSALRFVGGPPEVRAGDGRIANVKEANRRQHEFIVEQAVGKPPEGYVRLYRGEGDAFGGPRPGEGTMGAQGQWFSTNIGKADRYANASWENGEPHLFYVDIPKEQADALVGQSGHMNPDGSPDFPDEAILPPEIVARAQRAPVMPRTSSGTLRDYSRVAGGEGFQPPARVADDALNDAAELNFEISQLEQRRVGLAARAEALYADGAERDIAREAPQSAVLEGDVINRLDEDGFEDFFFDSAAFDRARERTQSELRQLADEEGISEEQARRLYEGAWRQNALVRRAAVLDEDTIAPEQDLLDFMRDLDEEFNESVEEFGLVGFSHLDDTPAALRSALGDGGVSLVPNDREILEPIAEEVLSVARPGTTLNASLFPFRMNVRPTRPAGSKLLTVPDVFPVGRPRAAAGVIDPITQQTKTSRAGVVNTAPERAADLAAQRGNPVPEGIMHAVLRGAAQVPDVGPRPVTMLNNSSTELPVRQAITSARIARNELGARIGPSRAQFIGRVKELFGSTDRLRDSIEYVGPATRTLRGQDVPAADFPLTGTIEDFIAHPSYYDAPPELGREAVGLFSAYDKRNTAFNTVLRDEYGVDINNFDTGIQATGNNKGIFLPTYDAGIGRVARGGTPTTAGSRPVGASTRGRTYQTVEQRLASTEVDDANFEPVTDIQEMFATLDEQKIAAVERETVRYAMGGSTKPVEGWLRVDALQGMDGRPVFLPPQQANDIAGYLGSSPNGLADFLDNLKKMRLGADTSLLTIKGVVGAAASPIGTARDILMAYNTALRQAAQAGSPGAILKTAFFRPFTNEAIYLDMAAAPERWTTFFTYFDYAPTGGTPQEWRAGFLERLPFVGSKVQGLNDAIGNVIMRGMEADFNATAMDNMVHRGLGLDEAYAEAAQSVKRGWLESDTARLGINRSRASIERGAVISPAFIRQPIATAQLASSGIMKLAASPVRLAGSKGQWAQLSAQEAEVVQRTFRQFGTFFTAAATTALLTAEERGWTPEEALKNAVLDVNHPDWLSLWVNDEVKLPLGSALRGLFRAIAPQPVTLADGVEVVLPFVGMADFFKNRANTAASSAFQLATNEDYYGNKIVTEEGIAGIGQALIFAASQTVPLFLGSAVEGVARQGESFPEAMRRGVSEFFGQNPLLESEHAQLERQRRLGGRALYDLSAEEKANLGLTEAQIAASADAQTLAQLREAIGTRAANAAVGLVNPEVSLAEEGYAADLQRRADLGDKDAEAMLGSVEIQRRLEGLAQDVTINGVVDGEQYRNRRTSIVVEGVGRSKAFEDVFNGFRESENMIDRLSAEWYDLFDLATQKVIVDGEEVELDIDWEAFQPLEDEFFARIGPDMAALVEANVSTAPRGANPAEVELRQVRRDLGLSGLWDAEAEVWTQVVDLYAPKPGQPAPTYSAGVLGEIPPDLMAQALDTNSPRAFRETLRPWVAQRISDLANVSMETALRFADDGISGQAPGLNDLLPITVDGKKGTTEDAVGAMRRQWVAENVASGLAERALQWNYVTPSQYRDGLGLYQQDPSAYGGGEPDEVKSEPKQRESSGETEAQQEPTEPEEPDLNELLRKGFADDGLSFGQLAIKYDLTPGAVKQRLRRLAGGAPTSLRV